jgi:3-isopropylmalate dehydratase small subunit
MAGRWLKNIKDGEIYGWNEILADNPMCKEVTEEEAFPEKFMPKKQKGRKAKVNLETEVVDDTPKVSAELEDEATRGLSRARDDKGHFIADDPDTPENEAWVDDSK